MLFAIAFAALLCIVTASPVQVFILLGQSNMLGMGYVLFQASLPPFPSHLTLLPLNHTKT